MEKMSFKSIFTWLYAKTLDRAMTERQPREDRETISPVYRLSVPYVSAFLSSMCSQWGLLALARRIYSSKDNSVCLSRCGWSASRISLIALLLLIGVSNGAWADQLSWGVASGEYKAGDGKWGGLTYKNRDWTFSLPNGVPNNVTFKRYCTKAATEESWSVSVSSDNSNWTVVWSNDDNASSWKTENVDLASHKNKNIKYLKFHYYGNLEVKFSEITVYELIEFGDPSATTIAFGDVYVDSNPAAKTSDVSWTNLAASVSGVSSPVTISKTSFGSIGSYGTQTLSFDLVTSTAQSVNQTVTISNNRNSTKKTIKVTANIKKYDQTLSWSEDVIENMLKGATQNCAATATSGLAVSYTSSNSDILSIDANGQLTAKAVGGPVTITASQAGNYKYNAATSLTRTFYVKTKDTPICTPDGFTHESTNDIDVGDVLTLDLTNVSDGLSGDFKATYDSHYFNVTRVGNTLSIEALNAGTGKTVVISQTENTTIFGLSRTYTFNISKIANTLDVTTATYEMFVDAELGGIINSGVAIKDRNNNDVAVTVASTDEDLLRYVSASDKVIAPNTAKEMFGASKKVTLTFSQPETYKYTAASKTIEVTVKKYANTIKVKGSKSYSSSIYVESYDNELTLTADNTDYTNCPITNKQTAGKDIATFYQNDKVVYSSYKLGTATWTLSQPENYKYKAGSGSFTVTVIQQPAEDCYLLNEPSQYSLGKYGDAENKQSQTYSWSGRGAVLSFKMWKYSNANDIGNTVYIYDASGKQLQSEDYSIGSMSTSETSYTITLNADARSVKFQNGGGTWASASSFNTYIKDIKVSRATWLNIATDNGNNGTLTINKKSDGSAINPGQTGVANSKIYWSCVDGGDLKIVCENPHFSFSQNTITNTACNNGTTDITVSYTNKEHGTETATVTVYNKMYRQTFTVKGVIEKADQLITWNNDILRLGQSYTGVATANTLVTYESSNESIIRVDEDDEGHKTILTAVGTGTVNITATAEESSFYAEKSDVKSIKVTDKQIQWIDWNQSLFGLKLGGANVTMNAVAASDVEGCVSSRLIEYSSNNESVVKVVNNNQLQIIGVGTAIITAVQAGGFDTDGHDYERAETEKTVIVRDPNAPCESFAYQQGQEVKMDCGWIPKQTKTSEINFNDIIPATGTLRYKGEYRKVAINYFDGTMTVEQYIPGENWQPVTGGDLGKPSIGTYKTANLTFDRRATKMRVKVTDGSGYHYFTDCQVTQARFIETTAPVDFNLNVGQQQNQVIYLSYSNITDGLSLTLAQGANSHFSVDKSFIEGSCGSAAKNVALTITYHPTAEETNAQDVLTITDGTTTCQVVLTGSATRVNRHINWDHADETNIYTVQTETLSAEARTDLNELAGTVAFSLAGSSTAAGSVSAENVLSFTSAGVADVVAYTKDDPRYNVAPNVVKTFNVALTPTQIQVAPTVNAITSGDLANINEVVLNGGKAVNTINGAEVEGTFAVTSGDVVNAGTNTLQLSFTPSNTDMYSGCTGTTTIVVNKATSVATPSAANIVYGQKVSASLLSNVGTDGTWAWNTGNNEAVLDAGTHEGLTVHFTPSSGNYTELDATVTLTVNKATPVVTAQATAITYGQAISASELSTASGEVSGTWAWSVDKTQVLSVGDHVLKANFTSTNANYSDLSNVDVTLTVNKIEKLEVPVALSFCAGGSVNFHGNTYTEAGEYQIEAEGETRDTVYNVTVTKLQPTTGTDSKTITVGTSESWNGINLSGYAVGSHEVEFHTTNAAGCDSTVTLSLTVVPATNIFTDATGSGEWDDPENWSNGVPSGSAPNVIINGDLIIDSEVTVGNLTIEKNSRVVLTVNGDLTVNGTSEDRTEYGNLYVENGGEVEVKGGLRVGDLTVEASIGTSDGTAESGQVDKAENIVYANAYIEINMDARGTLDDTKWYGFTVPFDVDARTGISRKENGVYRQCTYGTHYMIAEYDANKRLTTGKGWKYITGNTLHAGTFYYLTVDGNYNTYRFKAKEATYTQASPATLAMNGSTSDPNANWNAVGNSTLQHAKVSFDGGNYVQVYENGLDAYRTVSASEATFVVGCPFFIQATEASTVVLDAPTSATKYYYAPRRSSAAQGGVARVNLTSVEGGYSDQIYVSGTEKEEDAYITGRDLAKAGESKVVPQLWVDAYNQKLSVHEAAWQGENAICPLGIYAPKDGEYILTATQPENGTQVYLTIDGMPVWNISEADYVLSLEKGTMNNYGLMLIQASRMPTDVENVEAADGEKTQKIILNDHLYILRDSRMYDVTGKKVK